ncbi:MAG: RluA family pseudouridine synthase [Acholeplasmatales bacterium]|nr:RluA family pseudouridine synthase [Acholeplasmatales bacterium]MBR6287936.1 RluA family pseudouridine synthase [Acholeplasmatales bacterium]
MIINYDIKNEGTIIEYLESFYISKSKIYKLFLNDLILLNNHKCKREDKIKKGDVLSLILDEEIDYKPQKGKLNIVYEDDYLLIINKDPGIIIHNGKDNLDSLSNLVANYYFENGIYLNVRYAHRIDNETSGIIIFCKDILTHSYMNHFIENHEIERTYRLFISGKLRENKGIIDKPIGEDRHSNKMRISDTGKESITHYKVLKAYNDYSYLECKLKTGRKHQIRCHMASIGHPLLGDLLYGAKDLYIDRCALHSYSVNFIHPVFKEEIELVAEIPNDMKKLLK